MFGQRPGALPWRTFEHLATPVGLQLVGAEDAEVPLPLVEIDNLPEIFAKFGHGAYNRLASLHDVHFVSMQVRQAKIYLHTPSERVWVHPYAPVATGTALKNILRGSALFIEQLFGTIGSQPLLDGFEMLGVFLQILAWYLVRSERSLHRPAIDLLYPAHSLWCLEHDHRPGGAFDAFSTPERRLYPTDLSPRVS